MCLFLCLVSQSVVDTDISLLLIVNMVLTFSSFELPPPSDLTDGIVKCEENYPTAAGSFSDVYKCLYRNGSGIEHMV